MFYATHDHNGERIEENAVILPFPTREAAEGYLREPYDLDYGETLEFEPGDYSDCWIKSHGKPTVGDPVLEPFTYNDVIIQRPGTHPGGGVYWLTPSREVLVAVVRFAGQ